MANGALQVRVCNSFDDRSVPSPDAWNSLVEAGDTDVIFLTHGWQKTWWAVYGRGKLLLVSAWRDNRPELIASLFADSGMIFFVGSGGSDYLDFIGHGVALELIDAILLAAREQVPDFLGFRFYLVPDNSRTGRVL